MFGRKYQGGWAWLPAVVSAVGSLAGGAMASSGQAAANRTNIKLQREAQEWERMMANTAVQRRVHDLRQAGLNPMLAYSGEAATPNVAPARVENEKSELGAGIASAGRAAGEGMLLKSQIEAQSAAAANSAAQARLTNIQADKEEAGRKWWLDIAEINVHKLGAELWKLKEEASKVGWEATMAKADAVMREEFNKTKLAYEKAMTRARELDLPAAEADAAFWNSLKSAGGDEVNKTAFELIKEAVKTGASLFINRRN